MGVKNKDDILGNQYKVLGNQYKILDNQYKTLTEEDFYPPYDNRTLKSYIKDIYGGDNFADYCEYIFELYEEEGYWC
jgi:hypothetical protein